ncbi:hypothetical protein HGRIS_001683 [Hohenbuehelia grisea]|uniref:Cation efflux protein cytoplasmic domain-containing protein n=1 Tax=Hohenbuehelia grisea TaxID=104357 RepID=A0ABR3JIZ7_9AGAR
MTSSALDASVSATTAAPTRFNRASDVSSASPTLAKTPVTDVESTSDSRHVLPADPFQLRDSIKSVDEIAELRRRRGKGVKVANYYARQNDLITASLKSMEEHTEEGKVEEEASRLPVKIAIWASLLANIALAVLQLYAAISSLSLSLFATCIDSIFDPGSNLLLFWLHKKANKLDHNKWPVGGARLETIGNIVYGFLMGSVNLVVIVESTRTLITKSNDELNDLHIASIAAVAAALGVKFLLFLYCFSLRGKSSQVRVLWEDHRNDLFINGFGILTATGGSKLAWCTFSSQHSYFLYQHPSRHAVIDPMGAIIITFGVIISWSRTIYKQFELIAGKSAPHDFLQLIIYKAATFSDEIEKVDTVRAYHSGPDYFVEVDVVMDANTPLWKAHDISQQLQDKIEVLPNVERAFVHVDHETTHTPEHRKAL